ncbi:MAG: hypothetical protein LC753_11525 [Acidobacteria bacterium]|nr:hypothetical protein [Acidobacteriota bacterium]MCA1650870.1 hypothetical protein [Acidobacteriota bacterium]
MCPRQDATNTHVISQCCRLLALSPRELVALIAAFALTLPAVTPRIYSSDEVQYFSYLRSLWFDRDVSFENEYRYFYTHGFANTEGFQETLLERQTPAGRRINFGTIGCALLWAPFYAVADAGARLARALGSTVAIDGFSRPYVAAVAYGSAFYGFAAILLSIAAARRLTGTGLLAGVTVWLGTPLLFYTYVVPPMSHACSAFAVAVFVTTWLRARKDWSVRWMVALGASAALMAMVREQDVFFALGPVFDFALALRKEEGTKEKLRGVLAAIAACALTYLPQLLAYQALNGHPGPSRLVTRKMSWHAPHALQVLGSPEHGFLFWTPLAALSLVGLGLLAFRAESEDARAVGRASLIMLAFQVYVSGSVESWTVAGAFGQRRFVALTILLVLGLAAVWRAVPAGMLRTTIVGFSALAVWWNIALMAQFATRLMDRQRLDLTSNAYHAFVTLPRIAPDLAYRYFADRESFYESRSSGTK